MASLCVDPESTKVRVSVAPVAGWSLLDAVPAFRHPQERRERPCGRRSRGSHPVPAPGSRTASPVQPGRVVADSVRKLQEVTAPCTGTSGCRGRFLGKGFPRRRKTTHRSPWTPGPVGEALRLDPRIVDRRLRKEGDTCGDEPSTSSRGPTSPPPSLEKERTGPPFPH